MPKLIPPTKWGIKQGDPKTTDRLFAGRFYDNFRLHFRNKE
jgi:hypothetical protein